MITTFLITGLGIKTAIASTPVIKDAKDVAFLECALIAIDEGCSSIIN